MPRILEWTERVKNHYQTFSVNKLWRKSVYRIVDRCPKHTNLKSEKGLARTGFSNAPGAPAVVRRSPAAAARGGRALPCKDICITMLSKERRLRAREVQAVLAQGRPLRCGPYRAKYIGGEFPLRVAVVVSKKVARLSVERSKLRRQVYQTTITLPLPRTGKIVLFVDRVQS